MSGAARESILRYQVRYGGPWIAGCERAAGRVYVTMVQVAGPGWRVVFCVGLLCPPAASAQTESETRLERSVERDTSCDSAFSLEYVGQKASRIKQVK